MDYLVTSILEAINASLPDLSEARRDLDPDRGVAEFLKATAQLASSHSFEDFAFKGQFETVRIELRPFPPEYGGGSVDIRIDDKSKEAVRDVHKVLSTASKLLKKAIEKKAGAGPAKPGRSSHISATPDSHGKTVWLK
jgi:hypothetical protein